MHIVSRTFAVLATAAALTLSALPPTQASAPRASVEDRLGQIAQVEDAVPLTQSPTGAVRRGRVPIETADGASLALHLPSAGSATRVDGRYHLAAGEGAALAVAPTPTGAQVLIGIDSAEAPTTYDFGLRGDVSPRPAPDGGVDLVGPDGAVVAQVEAPWAVDAAGRHVPTRYELRGSTIRQVVEHQARGVAYPVVADPKVKFCDLRTAVCVKLSKKETRKVHDAMFVSLGAGVSTLCGLIPAKNPAGIAVRAICAAAVSAYFYKLRGVFKKAKKAGRCVELKFRIVAVAVVGGKVVRC